jgi:tRNA (guanine-N7-)-methyltransferase
MRYLPNHFNKGQLEKIFICFPDPHFKAKNHRRRIISESMLSEYAFLLEENGRLYTATDVEELHLWHVEKCTAHACFERLDDDEVFRNDPAVNAMITETEESKKVERMHGKKFFAVFRRRTNAEMRTIQNERAPVLSLI